MAATGTIELDGAVGDVGGVAQKAVAVRRAGAKVFFVPAGQLKEAESQAGSLKIYPFNTLEQALDDLRALGGRVPLPTSSITPVDRHPPSPPDLRSRARSHETSRWVPRSSLPCFLVLSGVAEKL